MRSVLVIEDHKDIANLIAMHLRDLAYEVTLQFDGKSGLEQAQRKAYDLIVLDLMLPGVDGLEICRQLRAQTSYTPILMVTAKTSELDRVLGLEMGADDYLTKPFSVLELVARVKALFRRMDALAREQQADGESAVQCGPLVIDVTKRVVTLHGKPAALTVKEFDLLLHFARNKGRVYSRAQLLDEVWGYGHEGYEHNVNCHINRLRAKIEADQAHPRFILTVRGVGYKFTENPQTLAGTAADTLSA
jgi:DNA-binding response OmpR family regulator